MNQGINFGKTIIELNRIQSAHVRQITFEINVATYQ